MEKFFLGALLTYNKLNIVDQQHVNVSVFIPEFGRSRVALRTASNGFNQIVRKFFTCYINNLCLLVIVNHIPGDGVHEMRFSESRASVDKKRIIGFSRRFGHRERRGMSKIIVRADNKRIKGIFRIQIAYAFVRVCFYRCLFKKTI